MTNTPSTLSPDLLQQSIRAAFDEVLIAANAKALHLLTTKTDPETLMAFSNEWKDASDLDRLVLCQTVIRELGSK